MMRDYFEALAKYIDTLAQPGEVLISRFSGESSDFVRFNKSAVRQATNVQQATLLLAGILLRDPDGVESQTWVQGYLPWAVANLLHQRRDPAME